MSSNNTKYQTLMANLLNIDTNDSSLFSTIDNEKYFDVLKTLVNQHLIKFTQNLILIVFYQKLLIEL